MKNRHKLLALLLSALFILTPVLVACNGTADGTDTSDTDKQTESNDGTAGTTEITETVTDTLPTDPFNYLFENKNMLYTVVYPFAASDDAKDAAITCNLNFYHKVSNAAENPTDDFEDKNKTEYEILIGDTNREESAAVKKELAGNSYCIKFVGTKLVVCAAKEWMLGNAVTALLQNITYVRENNKIVSATLPQDLNIVYTYNGYTRDRWTLSDFPVYDGGILGDTTFSDGVGYKTLDTDISKYNMICASKTSVAEFREYIDKLKSEGYTVTTSSDTDNVIGVWVQKNGAKMYAYYTDGNREARFILDNESTTQNEFSYSYSKKEGDTSTLYLYGIVMDPDGENNTSEATPNPDKNNFFASNCGQSMVIKLADNSVVLIDGGGIYQMSEKAGVEFNRFLHDITDTPENEKVTIRCWYLTHYHGDHYNGFIRFMVNYHQLYTLERVMYNLRKTHLPADLKTFLGEYLPEYYPNIVYHKPHTGETITLGDVKFDVMFTTEDLINTKTAAFGSTDDNDTSTVMKVWIDGKSFLITGDMYTATETVLVRNYDNGELKCDVMQVPHHGLNNVTKLFNAVSPTISLFTQSSGGAKKANNGYAATIYNSVKKVTKGGEANMYFAGDNTVGITVTNGNLDVELTDVVGDPYPETGGWGAFDKF
ncbi:MAG: hypothetical protein IJY08_02645 [Clostridia bacterium]|nr:hypothetical protein [Clostridia bacterium]